MRRSRQWNRFAQRCHRWDCYQKTMKRRACGCGGTSLKHILTSGLSMLPSLHRRDGLIFCEDPVTIPCEIRQRGTCCRFNSVRERVCLKSSQSRARANESTRCNDLESRRRKSGIRPNRSRSLPTFFTFWLKVGSRWKTVVWYSWCASTRLLLPQW